MKKNIYLDYMSTTPVDPGVVDVMTTALSFEGDFGNPASQHTTGINARTRIDHARHQIADLIHAEPNEIIFTSGATESINLALKGVSLFYQRQGKHIITLATEHKATLDSCRYLASLGFDITYLAPDKNGLLDMSLLKKAIRPDTILASLSHVNNETGTIQDIETIGHCLRANGVWFHVDAAQSVGKIPLDLKKLSVDLLSLASHKIYGPKGIGALYVKKTPRVQLLPQLHGGEQENSLRAGTLATHQIIGMGEAYAIAKQCIARDIQKITPLRDQLWQKLSTLPGIFLNVDFQHCLYNCLNIQIENVDALTLLHHLQNEVSISMGSACNAVDPEPSHVLIAMGLSRIEANHSIRISLGRYTTEKDILQASDILISKIRYLRNP